MENLINLRLQQGGKIEIKRHEGDVIVKRGDNSMIMKRASGRQTLDFINIIEPLGQLEIPEGEE